MTAAGELYVGDSFNKCVHVYRASDGTLLRVVGAEEQTRGTDVVPTRFNAPVAVCVSLDGELFVADECDCRIQVFAT